MTATTESLRTLLHSVERAFRRACEELEKPIFTDSDDPEKDETLLQWRAVCLAYSAAFRIAELAEDQLGMLTRNMDIVRWLKGDGPAECVEFVQGLDNGELWAAMMCQQVFYLFDIDELDIIPSYCGDLGTGGLIRCRDTSLSSEWMEILGDLPDGPIDWDGAVRCIAQAAAYAAERDASASSAAVSTDALAIDISEKLDKILERVDSFWEAQRPMHEEVCNKVESLRRPSRSQIEHEARVFIGVDVFDRLPDAARSSLTFAYAHIHHSELQSGPALLAALSRAIECTIERVLLVPFSQTMKELLPIVIGGRVRNTELRSIANALRGGPLAAFAQKMKIDVCAVLETLESFPRVRNYAVHTGAVAYETALAEWRKIVKERQFFRLFTCSSMVSSA